LRLADAAIIDATWKYRSGDSLERIQAMISSRLTAGVEDSSTGELAAWVLEQPSGAMGMLFTQEKFRRRGLARQVAVCVCVCVAVHRKSQRITDSNYYFVLLIQTNTN
jgi:hypothetical protein